MRTRSILIAVTALTLALSFSANRFAAAPRSKRPSIVFISIDTLRADHLSVYGYGRQTSPAIDAIAAHGVVFERACVPRPQTSPSHASMLTGVTPWKHGVLTNGFRILDTVDRLPQALARAGYDTAAVVAVPHLGSSRGFSVGFNRFSEPSTLKVGEILVEHRRDAGAVNGDARRFIDSHVASRGQSPLFLFVHYFDCHYPYRSWDRSEDKTNAYSPQEMAQTAKQTQRYDDGIAWTDRHVGELVAYARAKLGSDTVVVITGDHGEQIADHDLPLGHADIYRETVRVPLIVSGFGLDAARVKTPVSTMDIPVTLTRAVGAKLNNAVDGFDFLPVIENEASFFHRIFGSDSKRSFLVAGPPTYSRSLALLQGDSWYIRNFDNAYRYAHVAVPAPATPSAGKELRGEQVEGRAVYTVAIERYQPFWVTFDHVPKSPQCAATAHVVLEPGLEYFRKGIAIRESLRVSVPAARNDVVRLEISPAACAGKTFYSVSRESPPAATTTPDFFPLLVARRLRAGDELYDVAGDPLMRHNVIASDPKAAAALDDELQRLFTRSAVRSAPQRVPLETLQMLRSLGYL